MSREPAVRTTRRDVVWNYVGTLTSMAGGFLLLPLLLAFLSDDELGLWYAFVAVGNLTALFEFGFNPTFARNIVYCVSGARRLARDGCDFASVEEGVDWHLLRTLLRATTLVYAAIAVVALALLLTVGTLYVAVITEGVAAPAYWASWGIFCAAMVLNLHYLRYLTFLRGLGDVAGENRAKTVAKLAQLALSAVLLACGTGLVGAAVGYLANGLLLRVLARHAFRGHADVAEGLASDPRPVVRAEVRSVLSAVSPLAWRDGVVQLSLYACTQATTILASLLLTLAQTGTYSVVLQLATACYQLAGAYAKSFFPAFQSSFATGDRGRMVRIVERGASAYWLLECVGVVGVLLVIFPVLPVFKPGVELDVALFCALAAYLAVQNHYSIFCNYIVSMNCIPYMRAYLVSAVAGVALSWALAGPAGLGAWGLVVGQAVPQLVYNAWRWPSYVADELGEGYWSMLRGGLARWRASVMSFSRGRGGRGRS